jgi:hypothetical protein
VKVARFDPSAGLIVITARLWGRDEVTPLSLAIDTGSSETVIMPDIAERRLDLPAVGEWS